MIPKDLHSAVANLSFENPSDAKLAGHNDAEHREQHEWPLNKQTK